MKFIPKTEEELQAEFLLPGGIYDFEVVKAEEKVSQSGNDMIKLTLKVWAQDGSERIVFDYLLASQQFKVRRFAEAVGLLDKYNMGNIEAIDCEHKGGKVTIKIQKDKTGQYPDKNSVADYIKHSFVPTQPSSILAETIARNEAINSHLNENFTEDNIPF